MNDSKAWLSGFLFVVLLLSLGVAAIAQDPALNYARELVTGRSAPLLAGRRTVKTLELAPTERESTATPSQAPRPSERVKRR